MKDWLTRKEAAKHLSSIGYLVTCGALANLASAGRGPVYRKANMRNGRAFYNRALLEEWAARNFVDVIPSPKKTGLIQPATQAEGL